MQTKTTPAILVIVYDRGDTHLQSKSLKTLATQTAIAPVYFVSENPSRDKKKPLPHKRWPEMDRDFVKGLHHFLVNYPKTIYTTFFLGRQDFTSAIALLPLEIVQHICQFYLQLLQEK